MIIEEFIKNKICENTSNIIEFVYKYMFFYCDYGYGILRSENNFTNYCHRFKKSDIDCSVCERFSTYNYPGIYIYTNDGIISFTFDRPYGSYLILGIGIII